MVFVTGGTGFLGSHLLRHLVAQGQQIRALRRANSRLDLVADIAQKVDWVEGDVNDLPALEAIFAEGVTQVYHCAAVVSFHPRDRAKLLKINVEGTANIVNFCLETGVKKLVHVSSIAALGRSPQRRDLDETCLWVENPLNTHYAISKYRSEMEVWRGQAEGLPVAIVNPAMILGAGRWDEGTARLFQQVKKGLRFWPAGTTGFVDVADVVRFMQLLMESDISGERYILSAENWPYKQFFEQVAAELGVAPPSTRVTPFLAEMAWGVEWLREKLTGSQPIVTRESARSSGQAFFYDNRKSRSVFGFGYRSVEETIAEVAGYLN